jgi:hypothetical protein
MFLFFNETWFNNYSVVVYVDLYQIKHLKHIRKAIFYILD